MITKVAKEDMMETHEGRSRVEERRSKFLHRVKGQECVSATPWMAGLDSSPHDASRNRPPLRTV